jgi:hypothetical protein
MQMTAGFLLCRRFVFENGRDSVPRRYAQYVSGIGLFRLADWVVFTALVEGLGLNYLAVQLANGFVFAMLKFRFAERVFGDRATPARASAAPTHARR